MIRGLVAGFGDPLAHELPALRALGVGLIRTDCQQLDATTTRARVQEIQAAGLVPLAIIRDASQLAFLAPGVNVELRNEPDLEGPTASEYEGLVHATAVECQRLGLYLWAGAVSNLNDRGFRFLSDARVDRWPASVNVSVHWYPHGETPQVPHPGFRSREHEVAALKALIGPRTWGVSEFGYHTASRATWLDRLFRRRRQWTDAQVAAFVAWEWNFWQAQGAVGAALYQLNDGPTSAAIDRFGIRRGDGTWKPVSRTFGAGASTQPDTGAARVMAAADLPLPCPSPPRPIRLVRKES